MTGHSSQPLSMKVKEKVLHIKNSLHPAHGKEGLIVKEQEVETRDKEIKIQNTDDDIGIRPQTSNENAPSQPENFSDNQPDQGSENSNHFPNCKTSHPWAKAANITPPNHHIKENRPNPIKAVFGHRSGDHDD